MIDDDDPNGLLDVIIIIVVVVVEDIAVAIIDVDNKLQVGKGQSLWCFFTLSPIATMMIVSPCNTACTNLTKFFGKKNKTRYTIVAERKRLIFSDYSDILERHIFLGDTY